MPSIVRPPFLFIWFICVSACCFNRTLAQETTGQSASDDTRREWISVAYGTIIAYKNDRIWTDTETATGKLKFEMEYRGRTSDFVELFNPVRKDQLRLFNDHMEAKLQNGWVSIGAGHWRSSRQPLSKPAEITVTNKESNLALNSPNAIFQINAHVPFEQSFALRVGHYQKQLKEWNRKETAKASLQSEIGELETKVKSRQTEQPKPPKEYHEREWQSKDLKFKVKATLVESQYSFATVRKPDGKILRVSCDKLIYADRSYVENAYLEAKVFRTATEEFENKQNQDSSKIESLKFSLIALGDNAKPIEPRKVDFQLEYDSAKTQLAERERLELQEKNRLEAIRLADSMKKADEEVKRQERNSVSSNEAVREPTYRDALQVLVDELDKKLNANVFGSVTCQGSIANVVLESDYITRMDASTRRLLLTSVRDQWVNRCYGSKVIFKTWDGKVVAEL